MQNMVKKRASHRKSALPIEDEIAVKLVKQLDGYRMEEAKDALNRAVALLETSQIVSAKAPLLNETGITRKSF